MGKKRKIRVTFQKNLQKKKGKLDLTRAVREENEAAEDTNGDERVRAKGDLSRKRTILVDDDNALALPADCVRGQVLMSQGLYCVVVDEDGATSRCYVRRLLKSIESTERSVLATGDWVWYRPAPEGEGLIVRVEPRAQTLTRGYRNREQVIAANVEQVLIVSSIVEPDLKTNLVDRYLVSAARGGLTPILCVNKMDHPEAWRLVKILGAYAQLGYAVAPTSAATGLGIDALRDLLVGKQTVIVGQSGVGKTSLLNALEPSFRQKVKAVSESSGKGRHTTTTARLFRLNGGGTLIDTPGVRQFELWDVPRDELAGYFDEFVPFAGQCRFPDCTHTAEERCAILAAVAAGYISPARFESYLRMRAG